MSAVDQSEPDGDDHLHRRQSATTATAWSTRPARCRPSNGTGTWSAGPADRAQRLGRSSSTACRAAATRSRVAKTAFPAGDNGNANALLALRDAAFVGQRTLRRRRRAGRQRHRRLRRRRWPRSACACRARGSSADQSAASRADAKTARARESGVNLDEEAARLIQYQQSYQAAAKMLQVAQSRVRHAAADRRHSRIDPGPRSAMRISTANAFDTGIDTLAQAPGRAERRAGRSSTSGKRVAKASDDPAARGARRARARRASCAATRASARRREQDRDDADRKRARRCRRRCCSRRARRWSRPATPATATPSARASPTSCRRSATSCSTVANRSDGAGTYLFGGQGATQKPFVDAPGGVQFVADRAARRRPSSDRAAADHRRLGRVAAGAHRQRRVRDERRRRRARRDDRQRPASPTRRALTGADYTLQFSVAGGVTTYAVLKNGVADRGDRGAVRRRARRSPSTA